MDLVVDRTGQVRCVYCESIDFATLGRADIRRASHVEPTHGRHWTADLRPIGGPVLGPFKHRSEALTAEIAWLEANWLTRSA
jgi:hypothetical protein